MSRTDAQPPETPSGHQPPELAKQYRPADHEKRIWKRWIDARAFHADPQRVLRGEAKPYCVLIPPPNVTAALHLGHALNNTIQDILVRAHRMMGFEALWMPGTDHAGIATQAVVERRVWKDEKKRRTDFSRDAFIEKIQAFKDEYEAVITGQLKDMGCSCDWDRQRFTMDPQCAAAVREAFFRLFKDDLIYRGKRLVNWDPVLQTAVADDECYDEEIDGAFYYLRYPVVHHHGARTAAEAREGRPAPDDAVPVTWDELAARGYPGADQHPADEQAWLTVATTRPETYLGDTAVAINPHDPRAKSLDGLCVELPLVGRVIPVVQDAYVVLPERYARTDEEKADPKAAMATGFLKVTPAHDANDAEIGVRHHLRAVNVMAPDGTISDKHGWSDVAGAHVFVGLKREDARKKVIEEFKARGLFEGSKPHRHSVKHSDRSKAIIEPYLSDQWYVKVTDPRLAMAANDAVEKGKLTFFPARYTRTFTDWHDNIRDWCISRQLWWGHRIPVWSKRRVSEAEQGELVALLDDGVVAGDVEWRRQADETGSATVFVAVLGADDPIISALEKRGFERDPDVLDTWFSSALWPLSTLGWPDPAAFNGASNKGLLEAFNPTSSLCTAREIITLWVSRMTMFNRYFLGEGSGRGPVPFRDVFIHAVIQDGEGRKMSKTLGNGVDPLDIIATHGSDAMRFTLCHMTTQTQDVRLPVTRDAASGKNTSTKFDLGRNFATKLWNAAKFAMSMQTGTAPVAPVHAESLVDRWMLSRLAGAIRTCDQALREYEFSVYAQTLYTLLWNDFCDWYLEAIKPTVAGDASQRAVLRAVLDAILRLLHPVMPYVTEAIYEALATYPAAHVEGLSLAPPRKAGLLATAGWPQAAPSLISPAAELEFDRARDLVTAIREVRAQHNVVFRRKITLHMPAAAQKPMLGVLPLVSTLAGLAHIVAEAPSGASVNITVGGSQFHLSDLADAVDSGAERARLTRLIADLEKSVSTLEGRLNNPGYAQKAPPHMVKQTQDQLDKSRAELTAAAHALAALEPSA